MKLQPDQANALELAYEVSQGLSPAEIAKYKDMMSKPAYLVMLGLSRMSERDFLALHNMATLMQKKRAG